MSCSAQNLMDFLAAEPYCNLATWIPLVERPYNRQEPAGFLAMRALLRSVMLRRTKEYAGTFLALALEASCTVKCV